MPLPRTRSRAFSRGDDGRETRQLGVVTADGRAAAFTGARCLDWAGHRIGAGFAVQGNILAGPAVVDEMARAYEETIGSLVERLVAALEAGQAAGGDRRGQQSAAVDRRTGRSARWILVRASTASATSVSRITSSRSSSSADSSDCGRPGRRSVARMRSTSGATAPVPPTRCVLRWREATMPGMLYNLACLRVARGQGRRRRSAICGGRSSSIRRSASSRETMPTSTRSGPRSQSCSSRNFVPGHRVVPCTAQSPEPELVVERSARPPCRASCRVASGHSRAGAPRRRRPSRASARGPCRGRSGARRAASSRSIVLR